MKTVNKSLLAAAIIGAIALPGLSSAAEFKYSSTKQITYAQDVIVDDNTIIHTPNSLQLIAESSDTGVTTITAGEVLSVKVTLTNGAQFDSSAAALDFVKNFKEGGQTSGNGNDIVVKGTPTYSGNNLTFTYETTGAGTITPTGTNPKYFLELNSSKIKNLVQSLGNGGSVDADISVQNGAGALILSASQTIARAKWGLSIYQEDSNAYYPSKGARIDTGSLPKRKTMFAPNGTVGSSNTATNALVFTAGVFDLDITKALPTLGNTSMYINDYDAVKINAQYRVVQSAVFTFKVIGDDLTAFANGKAWLDNTACTTVTATNAVKLEPVSGTPGALQASLRDADHALVKNLRNTTASKIYVCLAATKGATAPELIPQKLSGEVSVNYKFGQRVNPPKLSFDLTDLELNGSTVYFQNVNPAGNSTANSFLRLTNHNGTGCPVVIDAKDDLGRHSGEVKLTLKPHASEQLNIDHLESGNDPNNRFTGSNNGFRKGSGKWYVRVTAECTNFTASALNRNRTTGVVTDLSPQNQIGARWSVNTANKVP